MQADSDADIGSEESGQQPSEARPLWRRGLLGVTLGVLLILCLVPSTRVLLQEQVALAVAPDSILAWSDQAEQQFLRDAGIQQATLPGPDFGLENARRQDFARMREFAQTRPNDPQLQLASATLSDAGGNGKSCLQILGTLSQRFPQNPSFAAAYLRMAHIYDNRTEDYTLTETPLPAYFHSESTTSAGELKAFDQAAAHGEKIDPDNAFFPFARLSGLLASHNDSAAISALLRAAQKPRWQDYEGDEYAGDWRLMQGALGINSAVDQSTLLWMTALVKSRHIARVMTYKAILAEKTGHPKQGMAIRHALMRCGSLMRAQGSSVIDALIGESITQIALIRPGGVSFHALPQPSGSEISSSWREYTRYLTSIGHAEEARWVDTESLRQQQARQLIIQNSAQAITKPMQNLLTWWTIDSLLMASVLTLLFVGMAARGISAPARRLWSRAVLFIFATAITVGLAFWLTRGDAMLSRLSQPFDAGLFITENVTPHVSHFPAWAWACLALLVPMLTLLGAALTARARTVPFVTCLRANLMPTVCLLTLLYCGLLFGTLRQEHQVSDELTKTAHHAGPYLAQFSGQTWPEATP